MHMPITSVFWLWSWMAVLLPPSVLVDSCAIVSYAGNSLLSRGLRHRRVVDGPRMHSMLTLASRLFGVSSSLESSMAIGFFSHQCIHISYSCSGQGLAILGLPSSISSSWIGFIGLLHILISRPQRSPNAGRDYSCQGPLTGRRKGMAGMEWFCVISNALCVEDDES